MQTTRDIILGTAKRLFIQQGYTATSIRQIAEESGIAKATVFHHFADKESLILSIIGSLSEQEQAALDEIRKETEPYGRIRKTIEIDLRLFYSSFDIIQIVRKEVSDARKEVRSEYFVFLSEQLKLIEEAITIGIQKEIYRNIQPRQAAYTLITMIQGTVMMAYLGSNNTDTQQEDISRIMDIYMKGIEK